MMCWISLFFWAFLAVFSASLLGCLATLLDFPEWNLFFVKSALGALAMIVVLGAIEWIGTRDQI